VQQANKEKKLMQNLKTEHYPYLRDLSHVAPNTCVS